MKQVVTKSERTSVPKPAELPERWYLLDAKGQVLGRLATLIATTLRGKHQTQFSPHVPSHNHVIVINAAAVRVTGRKLQDKLYVRHSGRPGSLRTRSLAEELRRNPERPVERAVFGMLPRNRLRRIWQNHLHVYSGSDHPHAAQQPEELRRND